jgi:peptidyl-prolyl cis-trans isomerase D
MYFGLDPSRPLRLIEVKANGKFDRKTYDRSLKQNVGRGEQEFREMQTREQLAARMRDVVRARVRVSDAEVVSAYERANAKASIKYVKLARPWFAKTIDVSNAAVDAFAEKHKDELAAGWESAKKQFLPECRRASHILVKAEHTASDEERAAARKRIEDARERVVKKNEKFDDVAREVSDDTSARDGGRLGCFQKGRMVKPFEDAVFSMKPGEVSTVVETEYGFHVIFLEAVLKDAEAEAEGKRQLARERMRAIESDAKAAEASKKLQALISEGKTLDAALAEVLATYEPKKVEKKKKDDDKKDDKKKDDKKKDEPREPAPDPDRPRVEEAKDFTADATPIPGVTTPDIAALAFGLAKPGDSTPDSVKVDGGYVILQLKDRERFAQRLLHEKQSDALYAYVTRLRETAKAEIKVNQSYITDPKTEGEDEKE